MTAAGSAVLIMGWGKRPSINQPLLSGNRPPLTVGRTADAKQHNERSQARLFAKRGTRAAFHRLVVSWLNRDGLRYAGIKTCEPICIASETPMSVAWSRRVA
jgi:hypothetical protein